METKPIPPHVLAKAEERGLEVISTVWQSNLKPLELKGKACGHTFTLNWHTVNHQWVGCPSCRVAAHFAKKKEGQPG